MNKPTYKGKELLPLSVIDAARDGDSQAVDQVLRYYEAVSYTHLRAIPPPREPPPGTIQRHIRWRPNGSPQSIQSHT